jgi:peptidyl-tRNA hydrolase, PTH1 family
LPTDKKGIQLIVGLGNPGQRYNDTRHNVGAWLIHHLAATHNITLSYNKKLKGNVGKLSLNGNNTYLFIPETYMNESGQAVLAIAHFYNIPPEQILVAHDELDFPTGKIRIKCGGGHGGHNGLRDTINKISSRDFYRIRIGINHPGDQGEVSNYVLSKPKQAEKEEIIESIEKSTQAIELLTQAEFEKAFLQLHSET